VSEDIVAAKVAIAQAVYRPQRHQILAATAQHLGLPVKDRTARLAPRSTGCTKVGCSTSQLAATASCPAACTFFANQADVFRAGSWSRPSEASSLESARSGILAATESKV